jgi:lysophospholipase L1-like esterase
MSSLIKPGQKFLFHGDSITDAGRDYANPNDLGPGYPVLFKALFEAMNPDANVQFINRGVSGFRVVNLIESWKKDVIDNQPDWVSILIGINEVWRRFDSNMPTSVEDYENGYRSILERTATETNARILILEPFVLHTPADRLTWRDDLNPKIEVARKLSKEFGAIHVSLDTIFASLAKNTSPELWAADGVHPTTAGHSIIATAMLNATSE